jgi:hypothetical protein
VPKKAPTHAVKHHQLGEANIYVAPSLQERLKSRNPATRDRARDSVCIRFRKACEAKAGDSWNWVEGQPFLNWSDLAITELPAPTPRVVKAPASAAPPKVEGTCCDDDNCVVCDIGNHGFCRKGCTLD